MGEIKTDQISLTVNEIVTAHNIYTRRFFKKDLLNCIFIALLVIFGFIFFLIFLWLLFPYERAGLFPSAINAFKSQQLFIWGLIIMLVLNYILGPLLFRFRVWRSLRMSKKVHLDHEMLFSDQGINIVMANANYHLDWPFFESVIDHKKLFVIVFGKDHYYAVPKRVLSDSQIPVLTEMLKSHIAKYEIRE